MSNAKTTKQNEDQVQNIVAVTCNKFAPLAEWTRLFEAAGANVRVVDIDDASIEVEDVAYALCFRPQPGRLAQFPNLQLIISLGAGVDHLTADPSLPDTVPIARMSTDQTRDQMADYVAWACLSLLRDVPRMMQAQAEHQWDHFSIGRTAHDCRVGILGLGAMGMSAANCLEKIGFQVKGWASRARPESAIACLWGEEGLQQLAAQSDILVCMLPSSPALSGIVDQSLFALMPRGAGIVNVARGEHVVIPDLLAALETGQLGGAVLDVTPQEPLPAGDPLWDHPRVIVTPHLASVVSMSAAVGHAHTLIGAVERRETPTHLFDRVKGY
ncbi:MULTISPECIES: 2-hydroxyacid dehydrogenase [unclassified Sphingobium]|uniref:2-hydroxyacid dehydrogenase n=1 Tax=unclassified Sphingobium TaxID=2611147 RepID=UPI0022246955|nr:MULTISPECIES: glyoxylate/hydroxypyruvate reductase A [unclassified Sphingobium]MCW2411556.1 glyoxylate/hydroxypyruvate reductase A [Sphingobium sp. B8D3D]MCW2416151.1 glyoxylate/hydroxypyruvate reductase A [Sphingobium sp. B8D3A]